MSIFYEAQMLAHEICTNDVALIHAADTLFGLHIPLQRTGLKNVKVKVLASPNLHQCWCIMNWMHAAYNVLDLHFPLECTG